MNKLLVLIVFSCAVLIKSDHIEYDCRDIQCPLPDVKCPSDSELKSSGKTTENEDDIDDEDNESQIDASSVHFLRKRSLQHRDSIKIIANEVDKLLPELTKYSSHQQSHRRYTRDLVINVQPQSEAEIKKCCPEFQCVCKPCANVPKCGMGFVAISVGEGHGLPGSCCIEYKCVPQWECNSPDHPMMPYHKDKCTSCECFGDHELCQKMCDHAEDESANNCFSSYHQRPILNGDNWVEENGCRECKCINGKSRCQESVCTAPDCPYPLRIEGRCCSICPSTISSTSTIITTTDENNTSTSAQPETTSPSILSSTITASTTPEDENAINCYSTYLQRPILNGDSWLEENDCRECKCINGKGQCQKIVCKALDCSNPLRIEGRCCSICPSTTPAHPVTNLSTETDIKYDIATPTVTVKQWKGLEDKKTIYIFVFLLILFFVLFGAAAYYYVRCHKKKNKDTLYSTIPSCESSQTSNRSLHSTP